MSASILLVDDEPNLLLSLEFLMKREGYEVLLARDGQEAMDVIARERPALVLLDVMMPIKSGFDVCCELRASEALRDTLVLMLTAKGRDTDVDKGLGVGADAYMTKPFDLPELLARLRALIRRACGVVSPVLEHGGLALDPVTHRVTRGGERGEVRHLATRHEGAR